MSADDRARAEYLKVEIQQLRNAIVCQKSTIAHLENQGVHNYDNRTPCVFEETEETRRRRQHEAHPPEIYEKSGSDFLVELRIKLQETQDKLAEFETELSELERKNK